MTSSKDMIEEMMDAMAKVQELGSSIPYGYAGAPNVIDALFKKLTEDAIKNGAAQVKENGIATGIAPPISFTLIRLSNPHRFGVEGNNVIEVKDSDEAIAINTVDSYEDSALNITPGVAKMMVDAIVRTRRSTPQQWFSERLREQIRAEAAEMKKRIVDDLVETLLDVDENSESGSSPD